MNAVIERNLKSSLFIIADLLNDDTDLINLLNSGIASGHFEPGNHGLDSVTNTATMTYEQGYDQFVQSQWKIYNLTGIWPSSYVPYQNSITDGMVQAMDRFGLDIISAATWSDFCGTECLTKRPVARAPMGAETGYGWDGSFYKSVIPSASVMQAVDSQIASQGYSVIMSHPQDFCRVGSGLPDANAFSHVTAVLDALVDGCYDVKFMRELVPERPDAVTTPIVKPLYDDGGEGENCPNGKAPVVLRMDDLQDYWITDCQAAFIEAVRSRGLKASVFGIAVSFGYDPNIMTPLLAAMHSGNIELGNHGWDAQIRWDDMTDREAYDTLFKSQWKLFNVSGVWPSSLVPHQNGWDSALIKAMEKMNLRIMSSGLDEDSCRGTDCLNTRPIAHAPWGATSGTGYDGSWGASELSAAQVIADVDAQIAAQGYSVIMTHPQDWCMGNDGGVHAQAFAKLTATMDALKSGCYDVKFMRELIPDDPGALTTPGPVLPFDDSSNDDDYGGSGGDTCPAGKAPVVVRLADMQDWWLSDCQVAFLEALQTRNMKVTVTPFFDAYGEDDALRAAVQAGLDAGLIEVANSARDSNRPWSELTPEEVYNVLLEMQNKLFDLTGQWPRSATPSHTQWDDTLLNAMAKMNMNMMVSVPHYGPCVGTACLQERPIAQADVGTEFGQGYNGQFGAAAYDSSVVMSKLDGQIKNMGYAMVLGHPQDFCMGDTGGVNTAAMQKLTETLDTLKNGCYDVVFLRELIPGNSAPLTEPGPIEPFASEADDPGTTDDAAGGPTCPSGKAPVVMRLDDLQDWWLDDCQVAYLETMRFNKMKTTVVPYFSYFGEEPTVLNAVKQGVMEGLVEVANSGRYPGKPWSTLDARGVYDALLEMQNQLFDRVGQWPRSLAVYQNEWNQDLLDSMTKLNMNIITSIPDYTTCTASECLNQRPVAHAVVGSEMGHGYDGSYSLGMATSSEMMANIDAQIASHGYAMVVGVAQDFCLSTNGGVDHDALAELVATLEALNSGCYEVKFLRELVPGNDAPVTSPGPVLPFEATGGTDGTPPAGTDSGSDSGTGSGTDSGSGSGSGTGSGSGADSGTCAAGKAPIVVRVDGIHDQSYACQLAMMDAAVDAKLKLSLFVEAGAALNNLELVNALKEGEHNGAFEMGNYGAGYTTSDVTTFDAAYAYLLNAQWQVYDATGVWPSSFARNDVQLTSEWLRAMAALNLTVVANADAAGTCTATTCTKTEGVAIAGAAVHLDSVLDSFAGTAAEAAAAVSSHLDAKISAYGYAQVVISTTSTCSFAGSGLADNAALKQVEATVALLQSGCYDVVFMRELPARGVPAMKLAVAARPSTDAGAGADAGDDASPGEGTSTGTGTGTGTADGASAGTDDMAPAGNSTNGADNANGNADNTITVTSSAATMTVTAGMWVALLAAAIATAFAL